jgi:hypothetical protein
LPFPAASISASENTYILAEVLVICTSASLNIPEIISYSPKIEIEAIFPSYIFFF